MSLGIIYVKGDVPLRTIPNAFSRRFQPIENAFDLRVLPMCPERTVIASIWEQRRSVPLTSREARRGCRQHSARSLPVQAYARVPPWRASQCSVPVRRHAA
jgi:hypothetical protein